MLMDFEAGSSLRLGECDQTCPGKGPPCSSKLRNNGMNKATPHCNTIDSNSETVQRSLARNMLGPSTKATPRCPSEGAQGNHPASGRADE